MVTRCADTLPRDRVTVLVRGRALTSLGTVQPKGPCQTGFFTAVARESRRAAALASDVVARHSRGTIAAAGTVLPKRTRQAGFCTALAPPAAGAVTGACDVVARGSIATHTLLRTACSERTLQARALAPLPGPAGLADAEPRLTVTQPPVAAVAGLLAIGTVPALRTLLLTSQSRPSF